MAQDVPVVRPKQLGIFDALVDRDELARGVASGIVLSERAILRREEEHTDAPWTKALIGEGSDSSGHQRQLLNEEVRECLETFFQQSQITYGWDWAVAMLFRILARDPSYLKIAPEWILTLIAEEKELLIGLFGGRMRGERDRRTDEEDDEDDEEQDDNTEYEAQLVAKYYATRRGEQK